MRSIFKTQAIIVICYTIFFTGVPVLIGKSSISDILLVLYWLVVTFHFMAMGILMAIYYFKQHNDLRNAYMKSFGFIWIVFLTVQVLKYYL